MVNLSVGLTRPITEVAGRLENRMNASGINQTNWLVLLFLSTIAVLMFTSAWDDSVIYDELEHVTAGYSYLKTGDSWLNVWHPPLVKDLAGLPLLICNVRDPFSLSCWRNHQKNEVMRKLFFQLGNDPQTLIRLARTPLILSALLFLAYYYWRIRKEYGTTVALPSLILLGASPSFIAHARFVHSDVPATAFFSLPFVLSSNFCRSLQRLVLSRPDYVLVQRCSLKHRWWYYFHFIYSAAFVWVLLNRQSDQKQTLLKSFWLPYGRLLAAILGMAAIGMLVIALYYQPHVQNMSPQFQRSYNHFCFSKHLDNPLPRVLSDSSASPVARGISWYWTGVIAQSFHILYGHPGPSNMFDHFYIGGRPWYFPVLFVTKEPLGSLGVLVFAFCCSIPFLRKTKSWAKLKEITRNNFLAVAGAMFVVFYTGIAAATNLNIGIRHYLPVVPFIYLAACLIVSRWLANQTPQKRLLVIIARTLPVLTCLSAICAWPGYLSYYNEAAGTTDRGYLVALDSNYDWGVDLLRLKNYVREHGEKVVYMCYYDHGFDRNYMGDVAKPLPLDRRFEPGQLIAVPASRWRKFVQDNRPDGIYIDPAQFPKISDPQLLSWFCSLKPIGKVGDSIILFKYY